MKKLVAFASMAALALSMGGAPLLSHAQTAAAAPTIVPIAKIQPGSLIRGEAYSAVYYYGLDGFRYVFPNQKTYNTWYSDFSQVQYVSDADLGTISIGGNVTYKPGVKMLKINSDPKTYAVDAGGTLRWVTTEALAVTLYGNTWNQQIDDVPDAFFSNYKQGEDIEQASDFSPGNATTGATDIDRDKDLKPATAIGISDTGFSASTVTISVGTAVKFTNTGTTTHAATAANLSWGTGTLQPGESFSRYFKTAGTYAYSDSLHPSITGTLIVQ